MPIFYNLPYRPDLNGIEMFWRDCKKVYRDRISMYKANFVQWD
jgi:transposase